MTPITTTALARWLGVSRTTVRRWVGSAPYDLLDVCRAFRLAGREVTGGLGVWFPDAATPGVYLLRGVNGGYPSVSGKPTWAVAERVAAGDSVEEVAADYGLTVDEVVQAVRFERGPLADSPSRPRATGAG